MADILIDDGVRAAGNDAKRGYAVRGAQRRGRWLGRLVAPERRQRCHSGRRTVGLSWRPPKSVVVLNDEVFPHAATSAGGAITSVIIATASDIDYFFRVNDA